MVNKFQNTTDGGFIHSFECISLLAMQRNSLAWASGLYPLPWLMNWA